MHAPVSSVEQRALHQALEREATVATQGRKPSRLPQRGVLVQGGHRELGRGTETALLPVGVAQQPARRRLRSRRIDRARLRLLGSFPLRPLLPDAHQHIGPLPPVDCPLAQQEHERVLVQGARGDGPRTPEVVGLAQDRFPVGEQEGHGRPGSRLIPLADVGARVGVDQDRHVPLVEGARHFGIRQNLPDESLRTPVPAHGQHEKDGPAEQLGASEGGMAPGKGVEPLQQLVARPVAVGLHGRDPGIVAPELDRSSRVPGPLPRQGGAAILPERLPRPRQNPQEGRQHRDQRLPHWTPCTRSRAPPGPARGRARDWGQGGAPWGSRALLKALSGLST